MNRIIKLQKILNENSKKRIVVVGTTCTGKSHFVKNIKNTHDMDELVFPLLTKKEKKYVCQTPWTQNIGKTMTQLVKTKVKVQSGRPVFGTVVINSDLIIYLKISDKLLKERTKKRGVNFTDAKNMQRQIEQDIKTSRIPSITFSL